jgi:uncharacterized Zn-finger protein
MVKKAEEKQACTAKHYQITSQNLPLSCPMPNSTLWNAHPRVYLPIEKTGEAHCPYCGTKYTLRGANPI